MIVLSESDVLFVIALFVFVAVLGFIFGRVQPPA